MKIKLIYFVPLCQVKYTEEYEQSKGKGSFPAMITPGYQAAKQANSLASSVSWCGIFFSLYQKLKLDSFTLANSF